MQSASDIPAVDLENKEMRVACAIHRPKRYTLVETHQASPMLHGERQQIQIGELRVTMHLHGIEMGLAQQAERVRPELVVRCGGGALQHHHKLMKGLSMGVGRLAHDAQAAILCKWAARPAICDVGFEPGGCPKMMNMVAVVQGNQYVDIQ